MPTDQFFLSTFHSTKNSIVQFPKCEPIRSKLKNSNGKEILNKKKNNRNFRKFGYSSRGCPLFGHFGKAIPFTGGNVRKLKQDCFVCMETAPCSSPEK